ncbi:MAG TPA: glycosyltransferase [Acidobacteriota bacterium]|nr:glycosyltransferase [Acidobacteriota bacterium]
MKILVLTTSYPRFEGDTAAPFIASMAEGIAKLGHTVEVVLPWHPKLGDETRNGVKLHPYHVPGDRQEPIWGYAQSMDSDVKLKRKTLAITPFALSATLRMARRVLGQQKFDLIHAQWVLPNGLPAARLSRKLQLPLCVSLHGSDMFVARTNRFFGEAASAVFRQASAVTACSPDLQEQAQALGARNPTLLPYGVDADHFSPGRASERRRHCIVSVGRLVHKKGFFQLIEAFAQLLKYYADSTLVIAGAGPLMPSLRERAAALGVEGSVTFSGNVERDALPGLYRSAELVAVPSITDEFGNRDGLPNVFLEALSCGTAVVASDIPGVKSLIHGQTAARIVPSGDVRALAAALGELMRDTECSNLLRTEARELATTTLTWERRSRELETIYRGLIQAG